MKLQKLVFIVSASIIIILLILLVLSNCKDNNLLIGVLSSTIVVGAVAFVQYLHEKNRVIFITYKISKQLFVKLLGINKLLSENNTVANLQAITQLTKEATECGATLDINEYSPFCKSGKILYIITRLYSIYNIELRNFEYITNNYIIKNYEMTLKNNVNTINQNNGIITVRQPLLHLMEIINYNMRCLDKLTRRKSWTEVHDLWMNENKTITNNQNFNQMKYSCFTTKISITAIVISILTIILFFCKVSENSVVNSETFISASIGILGLLVTVVIGYQIYNAVDITQRMAKFEKEQKYAIDRITRLSAKVIKHEHEVEVMKSENIDLATKNEALIHKLENLKIETEISSEDLKAVLYSNRGVRNNALSVLSQLCVIEGSFEISKGDDQYGMDRVFTYIRDVDNSCFDWDVTGGITIEEFENKVTTSIGKIRDILKTKPLSIESLCLDCVEDTIKIQMEYIKKKLTGEDARIEMKDVNEALCKSENEYKRLYDKIKIHNS